jgi:hypothetical protein
VAHDEHERKIALAERVIARDRGLTEASRELLRELVSRTPGDRHHVDGSVQARVANHRLRESLLYHFNKTLDGRREPERLTFLPKSAALVLEPNRLDLSYVEHFWDAHCVGRPAGETLTIIYTEPLFFFDKTNRTYVRFLDINSEARVSEEVLAKAKARLKADDLVASFHYQPSGEIGARNLLLAWFRNYDVVERQRMTVESKASRLCASDGALRNGNVVLLGNRRTNTFIRELQAERMTDAEPPLITIEDHTVRLKNPARDQSWDDTPRRAYAIVSRMRNMFGGMATMIAANHGRAAEKVADFLTSETSLKKLYDKYELTREESLPQSFQVLFGVDIFDFDTPVAATVEESSLAAPAPVRVRAPLAVAASAPSSSRRKHKSGKRRARSDRQ